MWMIFFVNVCVKSAALARAARWRVVQRVCLGITGMARALGCLASPRRLVWARTCSRLRACVYQTNDGRVWVWPSYLVVSSHRSAARPAAAARSTDEWDGLRSVVHQRAAASECSFRSLLLLKSHPNSSDLMTTSVWLFSLGA